MFMQVSKIIAAQQHFQGHNSKLFFSFNVYFSDFLQKSSIQSTIKYTGEDQCSFSQTKSVNTFFLVFTILSIQQYFMSSEDATQSCELVGLAGIIIQIILGALSFSILIYKRYTQKPKRAWKIWALDTSKQAVSQILAHIINLLISMQLSTRLDSDACIWYLTTNILDNTVGVFMCLGVLKVIEEYIFGEKYYRFLSGNYYTLMKEYEEEKSQMSHVLVQGQNHYLTMEITQRKQKYAIGYFDWMVQFLIWNIVVVISKTFLFFTQILLSTPISSVAMLLIGWIQPYQTLELILVIIIVPVIMNGLAFWMQDNFLKKKDRISKQSIQVLTQKSADQSYLTESTALESDLAYPKLKQTLL